MQGDRPTIVWELEVASLPERLAAACCPAARQDRPMVAAWCRAIRVRCKALS
eukprot:SAG22_NODE_7473_length_736_cov_1.076923_1_plen_51_part_01